MPTALIAETAEPAAAVAAVAAVAAEHTTPEKQLIATTMTHRKSSLTGNAPIGGQFPTPINSLARDLGITGTPAFVIGDTVVPGAVGVAQLKKLIADVRASG